MLKLIGTPADDTLTVQGNIRALLLGGDGKDVLQDGGGNDVLDGGAGDDSLLSTVGGADILNGGDGDDYLDLYRGFIQNVTADDQLFGYGGAGDDFIYINLNNRGVATVDAGDGNDYVRIGSNFGLTTLTLGAGSDIVELGTSPGPVTITDFQAGDGGDQLQWQWAFDFFSSTGAMKGDPFALGWARLTQVGADTILSIDEDGPGTVYAMADVVTFQNVSLASLTAWNLGGAAPPGVAPAAPPAPTDGPDVLYGTGGNDTVALGGGNDWFYGGFGDDVVTGGDGNDTIFGGNGNNRLSGEAGDDGLQGGPSDDILIGGAGNDVLSAQEGGADSLDGGDGDDRLFVQPLGGSTMTASGGAGADQLRVIGVSKGTVIADMGDGDDLVTISTFSGTIKATLGAGSDRIFLLGNMVTGASLTVTDFQTGDGGDILDLQGLLTAMLSGWDGATNPFATQKFLRFLQSGADTLLQLNKIAGQNAWSTIVTLQNTTASAFTTFNLEGLPTDGSPGAGITITGSPSAAAYIRGSIGPDILTGDAKSESIAGGGGNDTIHGGGGNDSIDGGTGVDLIYGDGGDDFVTISANGGADTVYGGDGNDTLTSFGAGAHLFGEAGKDTIEDRAGAAELDGGDGDDTLTVTLSGVSPTTDIRGGAGNDFITLTSPNGPTFHVDAGDGDDIVLLNSHGATTLTLGTGHDILRLQAMWTTGPAPTITVTDFAVGANGDQIDIPTLLANNVTGWQPATDPLAAGYIRLVQSGADTLVQMDRDGPGTGATFVTVATLQNVDASTLRPENLGIGTNGADSFQLSAMPSGGWDGFGGDDLFYFGGAFNERMSVNGGTGADTVVLQGDYSHGLLVGAGGLGAIETLSLLSHTDTSFAGTAAAPFYYALQLADGATNGQDLLVDAHGLGADETLSFDGADESAAAFHVLGGAGGDDIVGGGGKDVLDGGAGADVMAGSAGDDVYYVDNTGDQVIEAPAEGTDEVRTTLASYALPDDVENLTGLSNAGQVLTGNALDNRIDGGTGGDTLTGGDGNDILVGNGGSDSLVGGDGKDSLVATTLPGSGDTVTVDGGDGIDRLYVDMGDTGPGVTGSIVKNNDGSYSGSFTDGQGETITFTGIEAFSIAGTDAGEHFVGGDGNDLLLGYGGDDVLEGGAGSDNLQGGAGNDAMIGGSGNDFYYVEDAGDTVVEQPNEGNDEVDTSLAAYTLPANVEILAATTTSGQALTGNALDNYLYGYDGNDVLDGGAGADHLAGGKGNDVYVVDNVGDLLLEFPSEGTDEVRTSLAAYTLGTNLEILTGTSATGQTLTGNSSTNTINGGAGDDVIDGGGSSDTMRGGLGNDVYYVDTPFDQVIEAVGEGTDEVRTALASYTLAANVEKLTGLSSIAQKLTGNALDNVITGGNGADTLSGGDGNDVLDGRTGADTMVGGKGDDVFYVDSVGDVVTENAAEGTDEVRTTLASYTLGATVENLTGLAATGQRLTGNGLDNAITGGSGADTLAGGDGNDVLDGGVGADAMTGGKGNDVYYIDNAGDTVTENAAEGTDEVRTTLASYTLGANVEALTGLLGTGQALTGNGVANVISGGAGNDVIDGGAGADTMAGGKGNDVYYVDDAGDVVIENAGEGTDEVRTTLANYVLPANVEKLTYVGTGNFSYTGGGGNDDVGGAGGNDFFDLSQGGADKASGGGGNDAFYFGAAFGAGDVADGGAGKDTVGIQGDYTGANKAAITAGQFIGIDQLNLMPSAGGAVGYDVTWSDGNLGAGEQLIVYAAGLGTGENAAFDGSAETHGYFIYYGGAGADHVVGSAASDGFYFGPGHFGTADYVDGGGGRQNQLGLDGSYDFEAGSALGTLGGNFTNIQTIVLYTGQANDPVNPYPNVYHIETNDAAVAAGKTLTLYGVPVLSDLVFDGSAETDGAFRILGGSGNDHLTGGHGNDLLYGAAGADTLTGGAGNDTFLYTAAAESHAGSVDRITDFAAGDLIDLSQMDADNTQAGDQAFSFIGVNAFDGHAGELRATFDGTDWLVQADTDGDGQADFALIVHTAAAHPIAAGDFVL